MWQLYLTTYKDLSHYFPGWLYIYFVSLLAAPRVSNLTTTSRCQFKNFLAMLAGTWCRRTNEAEHPFMCLSAIPVSPLVRCSNALLPDLWSLSFMLHCRVS